MLVSVLSYHDHSFLNQPSEARFDSQVSDHKFPPEREARLQRTVLTHNPLTALSSKSIPQRLIFASNLRQQFQLLQALGTDEKG